MYDLLFGDGIGTFLYMLSTVCGACGTWYAVYHDHGVIKPLVGRRAKRGTGI